MFPLTLDLPSDVIPMKPAKADDLLLEAPISPQIALASHVQELQALVSDLMPMDLADDERSTSRAPSNLQIDGAEFAPSWREHYAEVSATPDCLGGALAVALAWFASTSAC